VGDDPKDGVEDGLATYRDKRSPGATPEPMGSAAPGTARGGAKLFVVHQHDATRMHWDLRIEIDGVLCSWAVPKAPSMDPDDKRLAVKVENHPLEYVHFEAVIPDGNYGAGPMIAWDRGVFRPLIDPAQGMVDGEIKFELYGYKLRGAFTLVHTGKGTRGRRSGRGSNDWLLIKKRDAPAEEFLAHGEPLSGASVLSGLTIDELAARAPRHRELVAEVTALGAPRAAIDPTKFSPMLCHTAEGAFSSDDWIYELKYDGFRLVAFGGAGRAELRYRSGQEVTARFPEVASVVRALPIEGLVIDGEVVVLDAEGRPQFQELAARAQISRASEIERAALARPVSYIAFDLLAAAGFDLRSRPLIERKQLLRRLLPTVGPIRFSDHVEGRGEDFLTAVVARGLEGVVAKKKASPYRHTRSHDWLKLKHDPEADFAVCGWTPPKGSRALLGALHLCVWHEERWLYAGKVGSGLDDTTLTALHTRLSAQPPWKPTFPRPEGSSDARWVEPQMVVQVRYREWPADSTLRFPVFMRTRDDKRPRDCDMPKRTTAEPDAREEIAPPLAPDDLPRRELRLTRLQKVLWPDDGISKGELIDYYRAIAPWMLPYLRDRPMVLTRYPDGITGEMFYQKDMPEWSPPWLRTTTTWSEHSQREIHYVLIDDADGLAYVANLASIPIHAWASRVGSLERPDWTILDLDAKAAPREHIVPLARAIHELCDDIGLPTFVKTSGQVGLHVLIPLGGQCTFDQARDLAYLIGLIVERRHPTMATTARNPAARGGRVYLDWGQNAHGQLLVAPFSVRPVAGASVSMPLTWDEVVPELDPKQFNLRTTLVRATAWTSDPFAGVLTTRPDLQAALEALGRHAAE
jgi:bifunctional non-homologous end joining protein LigD